MKRYGIPYLGSKNTIALAVVKALPPAENFYDVFCGGGAVAEAALDSKKYKNVFVNDLNPLTIKGLEMAFNGEYKHETRWISREDFFKLKDTDFYVYSCFSFGNDGESYCYGQHIEPWKKALHYARVFNKFSLMHEFGINGDNFDSISIKKNKEEYKNKYINWYCEKNNLNREIAKERIKEIKKNIEDIKEEQRQYLLKALKESGLTQAEVGRRLGTQMEGHYFGKSEFSFPTREYYEKMQEFMPLPKKYEEIANFQTLEYYKMQNLERLENLESLENLQSLQRLQRLQRLERLENLEGSQRLQRKNENIFYSHLSYEKIEIKPNSVIYCDPPYANTISYPINKEKSFNHQQFYNWCRKQTQPLFVSEYKMPEDFSPIRTIEKRVLACGSSQNLRAEEKLFILNKKLKQYEDPNEADVLPCFRTDYARKKF